MVYTIPYQDTQIRFSEEGSGYPVVLLHGYMEALDAWDEFASELSKEFRVIAIDLLGHGKTGNISTVHTMKIMAQAVEEVIKHLGIEKFVLIGHSMGGYVALEYLAEYPEKLGGLILFHSTPLADDEARKKSRDQAIEQIKAGKKVSLAKEHIQKTFSPKNYDKFVKEIGFLKIIAINHTSNEGIIAALEGMKQRQDHLETMRKYAKKIPMMLILGKDDAFIPADLPQKIDLPREIEIVYLENSGHQGYIEEKEKSLETVKHFVKNKVLV